MTECYACNRPARWEVALEGYWSGRKFACAHHIHGLLGDKLSDDWDDYSCRVRKARRTA